MKKLFQILLLLLSVMIALHAQRFKTIEKVNNPDGTQRIRVYFNYYDSQKLSDKLRGSDGVLNLDLPIPNKWELIDVSGYIDYDSSLLMLENHSSGTILINNIVVKQFKIFDYVKSGVKFDIDPHLFQEYNTLTFHAVQHYTLKCEDPTSNQLWTSVNLQKSYIDFLVRPKPIKEQIASLDTVIFDTKQYDVTPLNYVVTDQSDERLKNYALFTSVASSHLTYRMQKIEVASGINKKTHNVIIAPKNEARKILEPFNQFYIFNIQPDNVFHFDINSTDENQTERDRTDISIKEHKDFSGTYAHFSGNNVGISQSDYGKENGEMTVSFWLRGEQQEGEKFLLGTEKYSLVLSDKEMRYHTDNYGDLMADIALTDGEWHYVTATLSDVDVENNKLYIDGETIQLRYTKSDSNISQERFDTHFVLGGRNSKDPDAFYGDIDEVYIFNKHTNNMFAQRLYSLASYHKKNHLSGGLFIDEKLKGDINVIQNPYHTQNAIIVIAPQSETKIKQCISAIYNSDLSRYKRTGLTINETQTPEKADAYTAKNFIPIDEKVYFKELNYKSTVFKGWYPPKVNLDFKLYPDNYFSTKEKIKLNLHYVFPTVVRDDSVLNIYLNDNFAKQVDILNQAKESEVKIGVNNLFDLDSFVDMPAYLLGKGFNRLKLDFSLVPMKKGNCEVFNTENLVASVLDDSYFILPKSKKWIEMPYLELISNAAYPYAIYPDLQDTTLLLTNKNRSTIAAAMNFVFYLTQQIGSYPYYLRVSSQLGEPEKSSNIISFGTVNDILMTELTSDAPMKIESESLKVNYPFIHKFIEHKSIMDLVRNKKYHYEDDLSEMKFLDDSLIFQMTRSQFNKDKTIVVAVAQTPVNLDKGLFSLLKPTNKSKIQGDLLIYDYMNERGKSYNIKEKYIISDLSYLDTLSLMLSYHPVIYIFLVLFILILMTYILRKTLQAFKRRHHEDAE